VVLAMTKNSVPEKLAFLDLNHQDFEALRSLRPVLEDHADHFVAVFYRHLLSFDETRELLMDAEVKRRLLLKQREYLLSLTDGVVDDAYVADRLRIGYTHMRVGLGPGWYLGAYALYMKLLVPIVLESYRHEPARLEHALLAMYKILMLDSQLAMEAYIERRQQQLEYLNRELGEASRQLRQVYDQQSDELRQTSQRAQAAEELASVATLVAGLAHEIGTPMGVIQGHAELLESSVHDERGRWRLQTIRDQIDRIANIIQTLLNMARPEAREHIPVDLEAVLHRSLAFLSEKFRSRGVEVQLSIEGPTQTIGDAEKLQQLFLNLFINAADAMPEGGDLTVRAFPTANQRIAIEVTDTGQGMPDDVRARAFEPFFTTKEAGHGSGLGLMVVEGIVRDHGAQIAVESTPGKGTRFVLTFPPA